MRVNPKKNLPAYVKINAIMDYFDGKMAKRAIAEKYGVSHVSIINWVKEKDDLLRECKESARLLEGLGLPVASQPLEPPREASMQTEKDRATLLAENRKLRKENEYLTHRIAYMESLAQLMGFNLGGTRKKNASKPSISSSDPGEGET
jgi:transposase-like protein